MLYTFVYLLCDNLWPEVQSHSDDSPVRAPGPRSACALAQARPTMSCIHLLTSNSSWSALNFNYTTIVTNLFYELD